MLSKWDLKLGGWILKSAQERFFGVNQFNSWRKKISKKWGGEYRVVDRKKYVWKDDYMAFENKVRHLYASFVHENFNFFSCTFETQND